MNKDPVRLMHGNKDSLKWTQNGRRSVEMKRSGDGSGGAKQDADQQASHSKPKDVVICRFKRMGGESQKAQTKTTADNDRTTNDGESV